MAWIPKTAYFLKNSLDYPLGQQVYDRLRPLGVTIYRDTRPGNKKGTPQETFGQAKETLVVEVKKFSRFQTCKPSADYQLPLFNSCPGFCSYCYLATTLGNRPYNRIYVNREEIFEQARQYLGEKAPEKVVFEGSATGDPLPTEHLTDSLAYAINFFANEPQGFFRFVSKFTDVDSLLALDHRKKTTIRFSLNTPRVIRSYEYRTPSLTDRLTAAKKAAQAGYPLGLIIGPIFLEDHWQEDYGNLLKIVEDELSGHPLTIELITHRYTPRAKETIESIFPKHGLPMQEEDRQWRMGQFGYGKFLYPNDRRKEAREFFTEELTTHPEWNMQYFV